RLQTCQGVRQAHIARIVQMETPRDLWKSPFHRSDRSPDLERVGSSIGVRQVNPANPHPDQFLNDPAYPLYRGAALKWTVKRRGDASHQNDLGVLITDKGANLRQSHERFSHAAIQIRSIMAFAGRDDEVKFGHSSIQGAPGSLDVGDERAVDHPLVMR